MPEKYEVQSHGCGKSRPAETSAFTMTTRKLPEYWSQPRILANFAPARKALVEGGEMKRFESIAGNRSTVLPQSIAMTVVLSGLIVVGLVTVGLLPYLIAGILGWW